MKPIYMAVVTSAAVTCLLTLILLVLYGKSSERKRPVVTEEQYSRSGMLAHVTNDTLTFNSPLPPKTNPWSGRPYIIGGVDVGGSLKFINDFTTQFPNTARIATFKDLQKTEFFVNDILFIQHLFRSDITVADVIAATKVSRCRLVVNVHDWMYIIHSNLKSDVEFTVLVHSAYLPRNFIEVPQEVRALFAIADRIIHPSQFTFDVFSKYFKPNNFIVTPHIDERIEAFKLMIPPIKRSVINIGVLHVFSECKGAEIIAALMKKVRTYRGFVIEFKIVDVNIPAYTENGFAECLADNNIHGLTLLNKWGETYCYALTKFLNSGLPIIYNNFGAFKERLRRVLPAAAAAGETGKQSGPYFSVFETESEFRTSKRFLLAPFQQFLDYIIVNARVAHESPDTRLARTIVVPPLYNFLLNDSVHVPDIWQAIHQKVLPYCIYFPQHHGGAIRENDAVAHPGMTDIRNLFEYVAAGNEHGLDTPCLATLQLRALQEYDQSNQGLVDRQVELAKHWGMRGFCVYYYWFSRNDATGRNMVMDPCHDLFFTNPYEGFQVFFNWANDDWSPAVGNTYSPDVLQPNVDNLLRYFMHPNYLKIDNRPVLLMLHPWLLTEVEMTTLQQMLNTACQRNGFDGIHLSGNSAAPGNFATGTQFCHRPNFKSDARNFDQVLEPDDQTPEQNKGIQTLFFNFDNAVRYFKPYVAEKLLAINGTPLQQRALTDNVAELYKKGTRSGLEKILLVNAWNGWGEDLAVEPGMRRGCFYLKLLKLSLSRVL